MKTGLLIITSLFILTTAHAQKNSPRHILESIFYEYVKYDESTDSQENKDRMVAALQEAGNKKLANCIPIMINIYVYYTVTDFFSNEYVIKALRQMPGKALPLIEKRIEKERETCADADFPVADLLTLKQKVAAESYRRD